MESELGRITIPQIAVSDLELAKTLASESDDPRIVRVCQALLELDPKLAKLLPEFRQVFQELQKQLNAHQRR